MTGTQSSIQKKGPGSFPGLCVSVRFSCAVVKRKTDIDFIKQIDNINISRISDNESYTAGTHIACA
jgi:hypothetical protein